MKLRDVLASLAVASVTFACGESPTAPSSLGGNTVGTALLSEAEEGATGWVSQRDRVISAPSQPISLVQGSILVDFAPSGTASFQGTRGFRFEGMLRDGVYPGDLCRFGADCVPGVTIPLQGFWLGIDLPGTATLQGQRFADVGRGLNSPANLLIELSGTLTMPPQAPEATLRVPFTLRGLFSWIDPEASPGATVSIEGQGMATITLVWMEFDSAWQVSRAEFDIGRGRGR